MFTDYYFVGHVDMNMDEAKGVACSPATIPERNWKYDWFICQKINTQGSDMHNIKRKCLVHTARKYYLRTQNKFNIGKLQHQIFKGTYAVYDNINKVGEYLERNGGCKRREVTYLPPTQHCTAHLHSWRVWGRSICSNTLDDHWKVWQNLAEERILFLCSDEVNYML